MPKWRERLKREGPPKDEWLEDLRTSLFYDEESGAWRWLVAIPEFNIEFGDYAGAITRDGYVKINFRGRSYLAHRLAYPYKLGQWPKAYVDHKDRCRVNNAWNNLRDVSARENSRNRGVSCGH